MITLGAASQERRNNLDFLRFFFAALVIFDHSLIFKSIRFVYFSGWLAVNGFFVISGFLITASWMNTKRVGDYFRKRILRIYPAYIAVSIIGTIILGYIGAPNFIQFLRSLNIASFLIKMLALITPTDYTRLTAFSNQPFAYTINLSLWTIPYEFACYCIVALLGIIGLYRSRKRLLALFAILYALDTIQTVAYPKFWATHLFLGHSLEKMNQFPRLLVYFMVGMVFYFYKDKIVLERKLFYGAAVVTLMGLFTQQCLWLLPIPITYSILYIGFSKALKAQNFSKHGDFSYGVYLYGWPIQKLLILWFSKSLNTFSLAACTLFLAVGCAYLSWHLIEKPSLKLKKTFSVRNPFSLTSKQTA